ncbi:hypothetical protein DSLASN_10350 [Desulfoluna limicola]|uniref:FecR protein domain-containing protein n=1 Tax=Desulfoluna limicola TaxID=2810562 RepID=A0ABM7PE96_9BACT|nr:FecR domain-containing protein [Desulfoluna limicola]BCS95403.1 hypothetical protein DSLASN_10350 [Desulfoluna limicola]
MSLRLLFFFIGLVLINLVTTAHAAMMAEIGQVVAMRGPVHADLQGETRALTIKSPVFQDDVIKTEKRSRIQIRFKDNTIITLGVASTLHLKEYRWNEETKKGAFTHEVKEGVFRVLGGAITNASPETFKTETPVATIGIRGSLYRGRFRNGVLSVMLQGGKGINIINDTGLIPITTPGFGTRVAAWAEKPARPSRFSSEEISDMDEELAGTDAMESDEGDPNGAPPDDQGDEDGNSASEDFSAETEEAESTDEAFSDYSGMDDEGVAEPPLMDLIPLEEVLTEIPDPPLVIPPPALIVPLSGKGAAALTTTTGEVSSYIQGTITALNTDGVVSGTITNSDGTASPFSYAIPDFTPDAPYTGFTVSQSTYEGITRRVQSSPSGEFSIFTVPGPTEYELGFAGISATTTPSDGVDFFFGNMLAMENSSASTTPGDMIHFGKYMMEINWKTGTYIAHFDETSGGEGKGPAMFGRISGTDISSAYMIGPSFDPGDSTTGIIEWGNITGTSGTFYGSDTQGLGFTSLGTLVNIQDQSQTTGSFQVVGAAMRDPNTDDPTSPTGTLTFNGFLTGVSEDMANPGQGRSVFLNSTASQVSIVLNRDTGTVTGSLTATDVVDSAGTLNVTIGSNGQSAFVLEDHFAAYLGDGTDGSANINTLKPYGNFLITAPLQDETTTPIPGQQFSEHVQWGYWEVAYVDPGTGKDYHLHNPGSLWIAGERTLPSVIDGLINQNASARYVGIAEGIQIDGTTSMISPLTGGKCDISIAFGSASNPVTGTLSFDNAINLNVNGTTALTNTGFEAGINGASTGVNGAFFGPNANAIGGNFQGVDASSTTEYIGIFGGNKQ